MLRGYKEGFDILRVMELHDSGARTAEIAEAVGFGTSYVYNCLRTYKIRQSRKCVNCGCSLMQPDGSALTKYCRKCTATKICKQCGDEFQIHPHLANEREKVFCGYKCSSAYLAESSRVHEDKSARWRAGCSKRRARVKQVDYERISHTEIFKRDNWVCYICGEKTLKEHRGTTHPRAPELEHIISLKDGGGHVRSNVACACRECNNRKGAQSFLWQPPSHPRGGVKAQD